MHCGGAGTQELPPPPSVRGDLLAKLGRMNEARPEFERAASLTRNARERELLLARARHAQTGGAEQRPSR